MVYGWHCRSAVRSGEDSLAHSDGDDTAAQLTDASEDSDADVVHPDGIPAEDVSDELGSDVSEDESDGRPASPLGDTDTRGPAVKRKAAKSGSREEAGGKRPKLEVEDEFMRMDDMEAFVQQAERRAAAGSDAESGSGGSGQSRFRCRFAYRFLAGSVVL